MTKLGSKISNTHGSKAIIGKIADNDNMSSDVPNVKPFTTNTFIKGTYIRTMNFSKTTGKLIVQTVIRPDVGFINTTWYGNDGYPNAQSCPDHEVVKRCDIYTVDLAEGAELIVGEAVTISRLPSGDFEVSGDSEVTYKISGDVPLRALVTLAFPTSIWGYINND
jgi:hypothetical protein